MRIQDHGFAGSASGAEAVSQFPQYLAERERTKRLLIGAACLCFIAASIVTVFAPSEKQGVAYVMGAALLVFALGAIGATQFKVKVPGVSIETESDRPPGPGSAGVGTQASASAQAAG